MKRFKIDKLVRDKIVELNAKDGVASDYRVLKESEYLVALRDKLLEEATEFDVNDESEQVEELADLQEILDCIAAEIGATKEEVTKMQTKKRAKVGSFKKKLYIDTIDAPEGSKWIAYYKKRADRHPEIEK